jgi:4-aminobutyrate aminotransferase/(S)-3-amino-2-methylpropionate transaminase
VLVADEIQTGFGRTGAMFASAAAGLEPDLVCMAKSLSNGFPLSAVVGRAALMDAVQPGGLGGTFGGNPVACAAALGSDRDHGARRPPRRAAAIGAGGASGASQRCASASRSWAKPRAWARCGRLELVTDRALARRPTRRAPSACWRWRPRAGLLLLSAGLHGNVIRTLMPLVITRRGAGRGARRARSPASRDSG